MSLNDLREVMSDLGDVFPKVRWYTFASFNGGENVACSDCVDEAKREHPDAAMSGPFRSSGGENCGWCGR